MNFKEIGINNVLWLDNSGLHVYGPPQSRSFGPACPCHGERNMQRMGYSLYRCQESGDCFLFIVSAHEAQGYYMAPLPQKEAI